MYALRQPHLWSCLCKGFKKSKRGCAHFYILFSCMRVCFVCSQTATLLMELPCRVSASRSPRFEFSGSILVVSYISQRQIDLDESINRNGLEIQFPSADNLVKLNKTHLKRRDEQSTSYKGKGDRSFFFS